MFFTRRIYWITVLIVVILSINFSAVWARTSHEVSIRVAEIGRFHVENQAVITNGYDVIQTVDVVILSNSDRKWRFVATQYDISSEMEWSIDNRVWNNFGTGDTILLSGAKSNWRNFRFYIKVKGVCQESISLGYQLLFNE